MAVRRLETRSGVGAMYVLAAVQAISRRSSEDAIVSEDLDGVVTSWNRGAERLYGYTAEEIVGQPVAVLIHSDRGDEVAAILERIRRGERVQHYETVRVKKGGAVISVSLTESPILDTAGVLIGTSSIARDITERHLAEDQARISALNITAQKQQASQYARSLIEASLDPLVTISPEGKITDVNAATG